MAATYNPKLVAISFKDIPFTGFAEDEFITIERANDGITMEVGAGGDVVVTESNDRTGTIVVTLQSASPTNELLMSVLRSRELIGRGVDAGAFFMKDLNGSTVAECDDARILKHPKVSRGKSSGTTEWSFACTDLDVFVGSIL